MTTLYSKKADSVRLSFQLMTCAEPPQLVIETIKSLIVTKAAEDEILIIDNNNTKKELYEPLANFCQNLDPKLNVHFYHIDKISGFKAGALNLALELMDANCSHIVVVDSDYQALPQARFEIVHAIEQFPEHSLLQFPQFYRDAGMKQVHGELNHYFNHHIYRQFNQQRVLSTGTYAVLHREDLISLGGWSGASITEDAQLGVLMHKRGLKSRFIPKVIATGLLPMTLGDLVKQRQRWIYGNMQVLSSYFAIHKAHPELPSAASFKQQLADFRAHFSQLSAWVNFTGIFILLQAITVLVMVSALLSQAAIDMSRLLLPLFIVYAGYGVFLSRRLWAYLSDNAPLAKPNEAQVTPTVAQRLKVWALHLNFWEFGALSWLPVLWGRDKPFICTPKQVDTQSKFAVLINNLKALPKSILILNLITAILVAPFSPLYSPVLFVLAVAICVLKLWSATLILSNYKKVDEVNNANKIELTEAAEYQYQAKPTIPERFGYRPSYKQLIAANSEPFINLEKLSHSGSYKRAKSAVKQDFDHDINAEPDQAVNF